MLRLLKDLGPCPKCDGQLKDGGDGPQCLHCGHGLGSEAEPPPVEAAEPRHTKMAEVEDDGCEAAPSCLVCPLRLCKYELLAVLREVGRCPIR